MRTRTTISLVAALALVSLACAKKAPKTTPIVETPSATIETKVPPAPTPVPPDATPRGLPQDLQELNAWATEKGLLGDVLFAYDSATLEEAARARLSGNAQFLREHPELEVTVEGHCDERGTNEYNLALGERRAAAAKGYLANLGVTSRLSTVSLGEERPQCGEAGEPCWQRNRRAHFVITARGGA